MSPLSHVSGAFSDGPGSGADDVRGGGQPDVDRRLVPPASRAAKGTKGTAPKKTQLVKCRCGATDHKKTSHHNCPLNKEGKKAYQHSTRERKKA